MLDNEIYDAHLQHFLQAKISTLPYEEQLILKNIKLCNKHISRNVDGVYLLRSDTGHSKFFGLCSCKNSFVCPTCTAKIMKKHRTNIGIALDTLKKKGYKAIMITLAIPHLKFQSCKEVFDVLYNAWSLSFVNKNARRPNKWCTPINKFWVECGIEYHIRVSEFTYGENGFNPHFHMLVWTKQPLSKLYNYEYEVESYWMKRVKQATRQWQEKHNCYDEEKFNAIFANEHAGYSVKFSDHEALSSEYITGWGSDSELTGNVQKKATHQGHYTPYQLLTLAEHDPKFWEIYRQFAINVCRKPVHRRAEYSKGLHAIINAAKQTQSYLEIIHKKKLDANWQIIGWFPKYEWSVICDLDFYFPMIENILYLAKDASNEQTLINYLTFYGITISKNRTFYTPLIQELFSSAA